MGYRINTSIQNFMGSGDGFLAQNQYNQSLERLSSGLKINNAMDSGSDLLISDKLKLNMSAMKQSIQNANSAIAISNIIDTAFDQKIKIAEKIKVKVIQASQDGQNEESKNKIQNEINKLKEDMDSLDQSTTYNGKSIMSGSFVDKSFQIGLTNKDKANLFIRSTNTKDIGHTSYKVIEDLPVNQANPYGKVNLTLKSIDGMTNVNIEEVIIGTDVGQGLGALATAINKHQIKTGIVAVNETIHTTNKVLKAGTTPDDFAINGVHIGKVTFENGDKKSKLQWAINKHTIQHGVEAYTNEEGVLKLKSDGRAISIESDNMDTLSSLGITSKPTNSGSMVSINEFESEEVVVGQTKYVDENGDCQTEEQKEIQGTYSQIFSVEQTKTKLFTIPDGISDFSLKLENFGGVNGDDILHIGNQQYTKDEFDSKFTNGVVTLNDLSQLPTDIYITNKNSSLSSPIDDSISANSQQTYTLLQGTVLEEFSLSNNYDSDSILFNNGSNDITIDHTNLSQINSQLQQSDLIITIQNNNSNIIDEHNLGAPIEILSPSVDFDNFSKGNETLVATFQEGIDEISINLMNYGIAGDYDNLRVENADININQDNQIATITNIGADAKLYVTDNLPVVKLRDKNNVLIPIDKKDYLDNNDISTTDTRLFYIPKAVESTTIDLIDFTDTATDDIFKITNGSSTFTLTDKTNSKSANVGSANISFDNTTQKITISGNNEDLLVSATDKDTASNFDNINESLITTENSASKSSQNYTITKEVENITLSFANFGYKDDNNKDSIQIGNTNITPVANLNQDSTQSLTIAGVQTATLNYNSANKTTTIELQNISSDISLVTTNIQATGNDIHLQNNNIGTIDTNSKTISKTMLSTNEIGEEVSLYDIPWRLKEVTTEIIGWNQSDSIVQNSNLNQNSSIQYESNGKIKNYTLISLPKDTTLTNETVKINVGANHSDGVSRAGEDRNTVNNYINIADSNSGSTSISYNSTNKINTYNWSGTITSGEGRKYSGGAMDTWYEGETIIDNIDSSIELITLNINSYGYGDTLKAFDKNGQEIADISKNVQTSEITIDTSDYLNISTIKAFHYADSQSVDAEDAFKVTNITATEYKPLIINTKYDNTQPILNITSTNTMDTQTNHFGLEVGDLIPHNEAPLEVELASWSQEPIKFKVKAKDAEPLKVTATYASGVSTGMDAGFPVTIGKLKLINVANSTQIEVGGTGLNLIGLDPNDDKSKSYTKTISDISVNSDKDSLEDSVNIIDSAILQIDDIRGNLGSFSNKMVSTISLLSDKILSVGNSHSQLRDMDISEELGNFKKAEVFLKTANFVHAQSNNLTKEITYRFIKQIRQDYM
jgi:flagellin